MFTIFNQESASGIFLFLLILTVPLSMLIAFILLRIYRNAVLKSMLNKPGLFEDEIQIPAGPPHPFRIRGELAISLHYIETEASGYKHSNNLFDLSRTQLHSMSLVYLMAGCLHAAITTFLYLYFGNIAFLPVRTSIVFLIYLWPVIMMLIHIYYLSLIQKLTIVLIYFGVVWLVMLNQLNLKDFLVLWLWITGVPTLIWLLLGNQKLRAIAPLVMASMFLLLFAALLLTGAGLQLALCFLETWSANLNINVLTAVVLIQLLVFYLVWKLIKQLGKAYANKRYSDQQIYFATWWLLYTLWVSNMFALSSLWQATLGMLAYIGFLFVVLLGAGWIHNKSPQKSSPLLFLRVFGSTKRSEQLQSALEKYWRYIGDIRLIAGTDLATRNIEPHEFMNFLSGKLSRQFIKNREDLQQRLTQLDTKPDIDGRFRINEFFCHDNTWQMTLRELIKSTDALLMDLRDFSEENQGCIYELEQLLESIPLQRVVLIVGTTTDLGFLKNTLQKSWRERSGSSVNAGDATLRLFFIKSLSKSTVKKVVAGLVA